MSVTNLKIPIIKGTRDKIPRTWSAKLGELSVKFHVYYVMSRLGHAQMEAPYETKLQNGDCSQFRDDICGTLRVSILAEFMFGGWWNLECYHLLEFISVWLL